MTSQTPFAAFFANPSLIEKVYPKNQQARLRENCRFYPHIVTSENFHEHADALEDLEYIFSTWSMPQLTHRNLQKLPRLKAVFYAAGSVQSFARPFLQNHIHVYSAWAANAIPVAEFTLAQILLSCKGYFRNTQDCRVPSKNSQRHAHTGPGVYGNSVALIGFGMIGRKLADLLQPFHLDVRVVDPYVTDEVLAAHGTRRASLEEAFAESYVVSNHLPNLPATEGLLTGKLFHSMQPDATFINTGRGQQVNEPEMIEVLRQRQDLTALLDVTHPEPPPPESPLYTLPNIHLSSHIAGSIGNEIHRMADFMIEEFTRLQNDQPTRYQVNEAMLDTMA